MSILIGAVIAISVIFGLGEYSSVKADNQELSYQLNEKNQEIEQLKKEQGAKPTIKTIDGVSVRNLSSSGKQI